MFVFRLKLFFKVFDPKYDRKQILTISKFLLRYSRYCFMRLVFLADAKDKKSNQKAEKHLRSSFLQK